MARRARLSRQVTNPRFEKLLPIFGSVLDRATGIEPA
jgi:hypothetical protein